VDANAGLEIPVTWQIMEAATNEHPVSFLGRTPHFLT
jgi:hypothetical protein